MTLFWIGIGVVVGLGVVIGLLVAGWPAGMGWHDL